VGDRRAFPCRAHYSSALNLKPVHRLFCTCVLSDRDVAVTGGGQCIRQRYSVLRRLRVFVVRVLNWAVSAYLGCTASGEGTGSTLSSFRRAGLY